MQVGAISLVFGLFLVGRGLVDIVRNRHVADYHRRRNEKIRTGTNRFQVTFAERNRPQSENPATVRRQGHNVLYFGLGLCVIGSIVMILF